MSSEPADDPSLHRLAGAVAGAAAPRNRHSEQRPSLDLRAVLAEPSTRVLEVVGDRCAVVDDESGNPRLQWRSATPEDAEAEVVVFLDRDDDGAAEFAVALPADETRTRSGDASSDISGRSATDPRVTWQTLREIGPWLDAEDVAEFMTAQGMIIWHRTHGFCSRCGAPTVPASAGWVRRCTREDRELYPRTDPAVIMGIRDADDRLLLARSPQWPDGRRSVLAGFVEPGESAEAAVRREVAEEVGVEVGRVAYAGSQPWPFPASLMLGFAGWATHTDVTLDTGEIAEAEWFTREELTEGVDAGRLMLPGTLSIARRLIESWYGGPLVVPGVDERGGPAWHRPS